ncbi:ABC transporter substrate-binding protein [Roseicella aerolata]|uniref:ABC transporter substrate-binding protein n=1 Tax=Roseicella aerolata TaxID=2883479 RepID=A0A9X1IIR4_9PROT|nr:ABC transporter substrate-binding protein [Roseicella aerolata]MCB4825287.1 ABC transporter substrate-binding protein [Roseicella aerolata]
MRATAGRRGLLLGAAGLAARPARAAAPRVAAIDWGLAETLLGLGVAPVAAAELHGYAHWVREPAMPAGVVDLGLRGEPNLELLHRAAPELILATPQFAPFLPRLERVAPVASFATYVPGGDPLVRSQDIARAIGRLVGREAAAAALLGKAEAAFEAGARRLSGMAGRPWLTASFVDARHLRAYGRTSLFGATLARLGLINAWTEPTNAWGFATVALERLAAVPEAQLLLIEPVRSEVEADLGRSPLWQALPAVRAGRVARLGPCWAFGGLPSAMRFAGLLPHE